MESSVVFVQHQPLQFHQLSWNDVEKNTRRCKWRKSHSKIEADDEFGLTVQRSERACLDCIGKPGENQIWKVRRYFWARWMSNKQEQGDLWWALAHQPTQNGTSGLLKSGNLVKCWAKRGTRSSQRGERISSATLLRSRGAGLQFFLDPKLPDKKQTCARYGEQFAKVRAARLEKCIVHTDNSLEYSCLWRIVLESRQVNPTPSRTHSSQGHRRNLCSFGSVGSFRKMVESSDGMLQSFAK